MKKKVFSLLLILALVLCGCADTAVPVLPQEDATAPDSIQATEQEIPEEPTEVLCHGHQDDDGDENCDLCGDSVIVSLNIYGINDLHGKVMDADTHIGVDELTTYLENIRQTQDNVLFLSAGDMWQGSAESNATGGKLMTRWLNEVDCAAMVLGNHEFDWGEAAIEANVPVAEFPFLAINVYNRSTRQQAPYCQSSVMVECDGFQVGIIGAIGDCYSSIASDQVKDVYFITGDELTLLVKEESEALRQQGADFIVYVLHDGLGESYFDGTRSVGARDLAGFYDTDLSDGYVDLVFESHTHQTYILQDQHGVYHLQHSGDNNGGISHAEVTLNTITGQVEDAQPELIATKEYQALEGSPLIQQLVEEHQEELGPIFQVLGYIETSRPGDTMRQLVADLYYMEGLMKWGSEYDIVLGGGFISIREPGYLKRGNITYGQLQTLFPFDNELVLCSIKGKDLKEKFFETDHYAYFICTGSYGEEVRENLDPNATYYIVTDTYTSTYKPNHITEIERYGAPVYARDLIAQYIQNGGMS